MSQEFLLEQIINGSATAYTCFYNTYVNELYSYGISLGYPNDICMDAIHDVFCRLYTNRKELKGVKNIKYYLFRSLKNRLLDISKRDTRITFGEIKDHSFSVEVSVLDTLIEEEERESLRNRVESLMNSLTGNQREAIYLRYMQEMEYDEIAQILNINAESVRKLVYRGIDKLKKQSNLDIMLLLVLYFR